MAQNDQTQTSGELGPGDRAQGPARQDATTHFSSEAALRADIDRITQARHSDPFALLGMHAVKTGSGKKASQQIAVRVFRPDVAGVTVVRRDTGEAVAELERLDAAGFFAGYMPGYSERFPYRLRLAFPDGSTAEEEDPYRFWTWLGELDVYLFGEGTHLETYRKFGAHPTEMDGVAGVAFAVWAPNAQRVSVVGDFNGWDGRRHPMRYHPGPGVWDIFIPHVGEGATYKFELVAPDGNLLPLKADPFSFRMEVPPATGSIVHPTFRYDWRDQAWMAERAGRHRTDAPLTFYEVHLGSWVMESREGHPRPGYREMAHRLVPYVKEMGYSHIELMPITAHPFEGSWGYQPIGMFAVDGRLGTPEDFCYFVDTAHNNGIGVILDWVPAHFPTDSHGLGQFDGTALFEHADPREGFHPDWNTLIYNFGRNEVLNFLLSSALFWLEHYHLDGLRVDAVASMLYRDYSREGQDWVPNRFGGRENLEAIAFLKRFNEVCYGRFPGIMTIAEESTSWPMVSRPTDIGGLGFGYKWNMGWMHDTLTYMREDPLYRKWSHDNLTFSLLYAFNENFVLPLSHDEVVHGKGSMIRKMPGDDWQKFAHLRVYYGFMYTHPGKKLLFMGNEFGQWREWDHDSGLDWHLLEEPGHKGLTDYVRDLNALYRAHPALYELDCDPRGFEWIEGGDADTGVVVYQRRAEAGDEVLVVAANFTPVPRHGYRVGVPLLGTWQELLNSDAGLYGGSDVGNAGGVTATRTPWHGRPFSMPVTLPPLGLVVLSAPPGTAGPA